MTLTPNARRVLQAFADSSGGSIGARAVAQVLGFRSHGTGRNYAAGGYMARLYWEGWLSRHSETYIGARGRTCYSGMRYWITAKGRAALKQ
jgi:hypothetical protein